MDYFERDSNMFVILSLLFPFLVFVLCVFACVSYDVATKLQKKTKNQNEPSLQWTYLKGEPSIHSQPLSVTESWPPIHRAVPVGACFITPGRQQHRSSFRRVWGQLRKKCKDKPRRPHPTATPAVGCGQSGMASGAI